MSAEIIDIPLPKLPEGDDSASFHYQAAQLRAMAAELINMAEECERKVSPEYRTLMRAMYGEGA